MRILARNLCEVEHAPQRKRESRKRKRESRKRKRESSTTSGPCGRSAVAVSYQHIPNQYRPEALAILDLRLVYASEKVHGTSANIKYRVKPAGGSEILYSSGGASHTNFVGLFDDAGLMERFKVMGHLEVTVYGEAYGGKEQKMSDTYGKELCFIAFEVRVGDVWLNTPNAFDVATNKLGLEFVPYVLIDCTLENLDRERDRPSVVAERRGMGTDKLREGIVIRPTVELRLANGERLISKHVSDAFRERRKQPVPGLDPAKIVVLQAADAIADEWCVPMRLVHVLDKLPQATDVTHTALVIDAMVADIYREGAAEIVESREATAAIKRRAAGLYHAWLKSRTPVTMDGET